METKQSLRQFFLVQCTISVAPEETFMIKCGGHVPEGGEVRLRTEGVGKDRGTARFVLEGLPGTLQH
jgi:hypothetical protein